MSVTLSGSDLLTIASMIVTAAATGWAVYERLSAVSARKEVARFRQLLIVQQIAQQFSVAPTRALQLFRAVRNGQWQESAETALLLSADLASLSGARQHLPARMDQGVLQAALQMMGEINRLLPLVTEPNIEQASAGLIEACNVILVSVTATERALSTSAALGGDYDASNSPAETVLTEARRQSRPSTTDT